MNCCDGLPKSMALALGNEGKWAVVQEDADWVAKLRKAVSGENKMSEDHVGKLVKILSVDVSRGLYTVWVPVAMKAVQKDPFGVYPDTATYMYPALALKSAPPMQNKYIRLGDAAREDPYASIDPGNMGSDVFAESNKFKADGHDGLIYFNTDDSLATKWGIPHGWFIDLVGYTPTSGEVRWFEWNNYHTSHISSLQRPTASMPNRTQVVEVLLTDRPDESDTVCTDDRVFTDPFSNTCENYMGGVPANNNTRMCDRHAVPTKFWCDNFGKKNVNSCSLDEGGRDVTSQLGPQYECCACGGGSREAPLEAQPGSIYA